jgi:hypothetical protein
MAVSYQQQALVRKFVYTGLIVALFTVSLLHRRFVVEPQGNNLLLREVSRGEVKLTDSAVRLALVGSRGIAVTFLWSAAIDKQKRHEWNELDLLVSSITKLQPHFVTPWLFQSWNLAFNVAVECDRPRDKYFYISRGLEVLAEGERRNYKPPAPGNPDMRQNMGSYYQLKIGNSDEKNTMRCLLEMSCIDPLERAPERLWVDTDRGKMVKLDKFRDFCVQNPRLVRRLNDQLRLATPKEVVSFLDDNRDIPSRFEPPTGGPQQKESVVKDPLEQFPIMPPNRPNLKSRELSTSELVDIFFVSRNWYEYAQEPLPDPPPEPALETPPPNPLVKRLPRYIAVQIFRGLPARAQEYIAENLEAEGWFDGDGWAIKKWFDKDRGPNDPEYRVGTEPKFHARPAWEAAYQMYLSYGTRTGLFLTPTELEELNRAAEFYRRTYKVEAGYRGPEVRPDRPEYDSFRAHKRLLYAGLYGLAMTNFPEHLTQTDAERDPETVMARKLFYQAERFRRAEDPERAIPLYQQAWKLWTQVFLAHPKFAQNSLVLEDLYETQIRYNFYVQKHRSEVFKPVTMGLAQLATWPYPPFFDRLTVSQKVKILPVRNHRGILDYLLFFDGPHAEELKIALTAWTQGSIQAMHGVLPSEVQSQLVSGAVAMGLGGTDLVLPTQVRFQLTRAIARDTTVAADSQWRVLVDATTAYRVRDRLGLNRSEKKETR